MALINLNEMISERLQSGGITCPACEEPMLDSADDGPYITWRRTAEREHHASGVCWARETELRLTLWSAPCGEPGGYDMPNQDEMLSQIVRALTADAPIGMQVFAYVALDQLDGAYVASVNRLAYDAKVTIRENVD